MESMANMNVNLVAENDNQKFSVHRSIMTASSKYFEALIGFHALECHGENIVLKDIDGETLKSIIDYIDHQNSCAIAGSPCMQLIELEKRCAGFVEKFPLTMKNCVEVLVDADKHHLVELKSKAFIMTCAAYEELSNSEIAIIDEKIYRELLMCNRISADEYDIFNGLVYWLSINKAEKDISIPEFLNLIRLRHIPLQILKDDVAPIFEKYEQKELIFNEYRRRYLHASNDFGVGRRRKNISEDIYLVSRLTDELIFIKYEQTTNDWVEIKKIASKGVGSMAVANGKLYFMEQTTQKVWAYDLIDFTRVQLPDMNSSRTDFTSIVVGNFIYVFDGARDGYGHDERFDIKRQTWTKWNNIPRDSMSYFRIAIEYNGSIHVAQSYFSSERTHCKLYCYNIANDISECYAKVAPRATFAKTLSSLYVIENDRVLHRYDDINAVLTKIGDFTFTGRINQAVGLRGEIYLLGENHFAKLARHLNHLKKFELKSVTNDCVSLLYVN